MSLLKKLQQLVCQVETLVLAISTLSITGTGLKPKKVGQLESSATKPFLSHSSTNIHFPMFIERGYHWTVKAVNLNLEI